MNKIMGWFLAASLIGSMASANESQRLNVLFISIDDLRPELGCYGDSVVKSPNIDKLASEGMIFDRAYCQVPVCGASRASMMTGMLPTNVRFTEAKSRADVDAPNAKTMAQVFKEAGYTTIANGKIFHEAEDTSERSWTKREGSGMSHMDSMDPATTAVLSKRGRGRFYECVDVPDNAYGDGKVAENTIADLRALKESGEPFFLACGFIRPHLPFYAPKKYWDLYDEAELPIADNQYRPKDAPNVLRGFKEYGVYEMNGYQPGTEAFHRKMRHGYFAATSYADKLAGDVLNELEKLGLADNTIIVLWGDHGWHLGEHDFWGKHNTLYNAVRLPLIVKVPGKMGGVKSDSLIATVDIFPTLCGLAGLDVPKSVQGKSFEALLDHPEQKFNEVVYTRFRAADTVVTNRYTYTLFETGEEMLFDLKKDPQENQNVANNPEYSEALKSMREKLKEQMAKAAAAAL